MRETTAKPRTLYELMTETANKLAKRPVIVRLQAPATKGLLGEIHKAASGKIVIDLRPDLDNSQTITVLLHEIGHARTMDFSPSYYYKQAPGSIPRTPLTNPQKAHETKANQLASKWELWGKQNARPDLPYIEGILTALYYDYTE